MVLFCLIQFRVVDLGPSLSGTARADVAEAPSQEGVRPAWLRDEVGHIPRRFDLKSSQAILWFRA